MMGIEITNVIDATPMDAEHPIFNEAGGVTDTCDAKLAIDPTYQKFQNSLEFEQDFRQNFGEYVKATDRKCVELLEFFDANN